MNKKMIMMVLLLLLQTQVYAAMPVIRNQLADGTYQQVGKMINAKQAIYVLTSKKKWQQAQAVGVYTDKTLDEVGFIHASKYDEMVRVANAFYLKRHGLMLLQINPALVTSLVKYEDPAVMLPSFKKDERFPHIYGSLNLDAVMKVLPVSKNTDGRFDKTSLSLNEF